MLQSQTTELQYQLREDNDRIALLTEELSEVRREQQSRVRGTSSSAEDVARLLAAAESKYESKISELRRQLSAVEAERTEIETDWSRKLEEKTQDTDKWKRTYESILSSQRDQDIIVHDLRAEIERLKQDARAYRVQLSELQSQAEQLTQVEVCVAFLLCGN